MRSNTILRGISLVILSFSILNLLRSCGSTNSSTEDLVHDMGYEMAMAVLPALEEGHEIIVLTVPTGLAEDTRIQKNNLLKKLKKKGVVILEERMLNRNKAPGEWHFHEDKGFSLDEYLEAVQAHPDADAILSLAGHLRLSEYDLRDLPEDTPPLILTFVSSKQPFLDELLERGIVKLAIIPCPEEERTFSGRPESAAQWLTEYFDIITPDGKI